MVFFSYPRGEADAAARLPRITRPAMVSEWYVVLEVIHRLRWRGRGGCISLGGLPYFGLPLVYCQIPLAALADFNLSFNVAIFIETAIVERRCIQPLTQLFFVDLYFSLYKFFVGFKDTNTVDELYVIQISSNRIAVIDEAAAATSKM